MSELFSTVTSILSQIPTSGVLRERVMYLKDQIEVMDKQLKDLEQENASLRSRIAEFNDSEAVKALSGDFVEHRGALFKRKSGGGYEHAVYCPDCRRSTFSMEKFLPYFCDKCQWGTDFTGKELDDVLKELPNP